MPEARVIDREKNKKKAKGKLKRDEKKQKTRPTVASTSKSDAPSNGDAQPAAELTVTHPGTSEDAPSSPCSKRSHEEAGLVG
jgi:hypothetical protein